MPDTNKLQNITDAAVAIRKAQASLMQASRTCTDPVSSAKITAEYTHLNSMFQQLQHALAITDDAAFNAATNLLKQSAESFQADEDQLKAIIGDVKTAASVVGYIEQAVSVLMTM